MSFLVVSIHVRSADEIDPALDRAVQAVRHGATLIEWRVDALAATEDDSITLVTDLVRRAPAPCIVTCRPTWEGGEFDGEESDRAALFETLATQDDQPRYMDVELAAFQRNESLRRHIGTAVRESGRSGPGQVGLILSTHDFEGRPRDLIQRVEAMANELSCRIMKAAWRARSVRDNLEAFDLLAERTKPMIALCMGEFGLMSRVLAPKFGGLLTFAADEPGAETAPGQPTVSELRSRYRFDAIGRKTRVYGVIGWPVGHSRSPQIHNAAFTAVNEDAVYLPLPIPPEYEHFKATVGALIDHPHLDFRGASVTIPHKQNLLRFVTERGGRADAAAERIGAANTLIVGTAGATACTNTDSAAAVEALCAGMKIEPEALSPLRIAVIGAGGVARAVIAGISAAGARIVVFNRTIEHAEALVNEFNEQSLGGGRKAIVELGRLSSLGNGSFHVYINCTSIGMAGGPAADRSPLELEDGGHVKLDDRVTVFDTVYTPLRTPMIADAEARGARIIPGIDMFIRQAAMQFEAWTGKEMPKDVARDALASM